MIQVFRNFSYTQTFISFYYVFYKMRKDTRIQFELNVSIVTKQIVSDKYIVNTKKKCSKKCKAFSWLCTNWSDNIYSTVLGIRWCMETRTKYEKKEQIKILLILFALFILFFFYLFFVWRSTCHRHNFILKAWKKRYNFEMLMGRTISSFN